MKVNLVKFIETQRVRYRLQRTIKIPAGLIAPGLTVSGAADLPVDLVVETVCWDHSKREANAVLAAKILPDDLSDEAAEGYIGRTYGDAWAVDKVYLTMEGLNRHIAKMDAKRSG